MPLSRRTLKKTIHRAVLAALSVASDGQMPTEFRIWKAGINPDRNGYDVLFDDKAAEQVMAAYHEHGIELMLDLEHLSLDDQAPNYDPDARGWCKLEVRNGELWAVGLRLTPDGETRLTNQTQRYPSPAFRTDKDGRPTRVFNIALCAMPATDHIEALVAKETEPEMINLKKLSAVAKSIRALHKSGVDAKQIVKTLADDTATGDGEAAGVDIAGLADFLQISINPAQDPAGFVKALMAKLDEVSAALRGDEPSAPAADPEAPAAEMAAAKALFRLLRADNAVDAIVTASEWRTLAVEHDARLRKLATEEKALESTKKRALVARLVVCKSETPATAWADDAKTIPAKHLACLSVEELEARAANFEAAKGIKTTGADGHEPETAGALTKQEKALAKELKMTDEAFVIHKTKVDAKRGRGASAHG